MIRSVFSEWISLFGLRVRPGSSGILQKETIGAFSGNFFRLGVPGRKRTNQLVFQVEPPTQKDSRYLKNNNKNVFSNLYFNIFK